MCPASSGGSSGSAGRSRSPSRGRRRPRTSSTPRRWTRGCGPVHAGASTRDLMAIMARVTWGCEPDEVSMLHAVRYVKAAGGLGRMLDVEGGAQQDRFPGGTQQIALRMADELGDRVVLSAAVRRIERHDEGAVDGRFRPRTGGGAGGCRGHPAGAPRRHRVRPALPAEYEKLTHHWPQGKLSKAYAAYDTPFWRANGCSGEALSDEGPVFITFDVSPGDRGSRHPAGIHRCAHLRSTAGRRTARAALAGFATLFGEAALHPIDYVDHCWGAEEFAPGGPTAAVPPGSWTRYGPWLRKPRRRHLLGRHRNRRQMDRFPRRRRPVGSARGRRGPPTVVLGAGPSLPGHRLDERP